MKSKSSVYLALLVLLCVPNVVTAEIGSIPPSEGRGREISRVYYEGGALFSETDLFSDVNNGFYRTYHRNGRLRSEVRYKNGWEIYDKAFDEQGRPFIRNGPVRNYYGGGNMLSDIVYYSNDKKHGTGTYYYYDGKTVVDVWHYFDGVRSGIHTRNDEYGRLRYNEDWGYPTYYVERLKRNADFLTVFVGILLGVITALVTRQRPGEAKPR